MTDWWWWMHGYAAYVWPAYGLFLAVFMGISECARRRERAVHHAIKTWQAK